MKGAYKKFSKSLFKKHDPKSRRIVKEYFSKNNIPLVDNPDKYGVDLLSKDKSLQIEVEHRGFWKTAKFPDKTVHILERKAKYFVENHICYVILSDDYSHIGMINGEALMKYLTDQYLIEVPNKFVAKGEFMYDVPVEAFKWDKL